jgi:hypothetical protein
MRGFKERLIIGLFGLAILLTPIWVYYNRHSILNKISPFSNLSNKIAVDSIHMLDWDDNPDDNEIFLVDTLSKAIRQITNDSFRDEKPTISITENRVYFLSNRSSDNSSLTIHYYDIKTKIFKNAYNEFKHILVSERADLKDIIVNKSKIAIVESYDSTRLYLVDLENKGLLSKWTVKPITVIIDINDKEIITKQNGTISKLTIGQ